MNIKVEFVLFSREFPVDWVYEKIGILGYKNITKEMKFNMLSNDEYVKDEECSITYSTGYIDAIDVDMAINKMYNMLFERKNQIIECIKCFNLTAKFYVVINLSDNPIIEISNRFINLVSDLKADISFDTYLDYDEDGMPIIN